MALVTLTDAHLAYGHVPLLDGAGFALDAGERVALIGRNGSGKSSLLKILAGHEHPDDGLLQVQQGLRRFYVAQEPAFDLRATVFDAVAEALAEVRTLRERYERHEPGDDLDVLQTRIEHLDGWTWEQRVEETLQHLRLEAGAVVGALSGGVRKRVALAQALVARPDVLLLDEPTNHLDLDAIEWLQALLVGWRGAGGGSPGALVFVSHDRAFIDAVATRIVELDRGRLRSYPGDFAAFEAARERELEAEALAAARADKLLAQEEAWIRKGVEARRTRSVSRVARLVRLREERRARRERLGQVRLELDAGVPSGKVVAQLRDVSLWYPGARAERGGAGRDAGAGPGAAPRGPGPGDRLVVRNFSATILRGDKVGLIGPNGCGKTSLLKLILGELEPSAGSVRRGTNLSIAYFDQMRSALAGAPPAAGAGAAAPEAGGPGLDATLADTISPGSEWVEINGQRRHVIGYLADFLFPPARAHAPVRTLSGGERNRLLLARLFALPANVLVLDEPTNDLDIETLELLEELLQAYAGTVFLVSHDRRFLDNVVTSTIAWEGDVAAGLWREYEGGIEDWRAQRARAAAGQGAPAPSRPTPALSPADPSWTGADGHAPVVGAAAQGAGAAPGPADAPGADRHAASRAPGAAPRKLSYKEQREFDALPARIDALEEEQKAIAEHLASPSLYTDEPQRVAQLQARYAQIDDELAAALERWEALGARA